MSHAKIAARWAKQATNRAGKKMGISGSLSYQNGSLHSYGTLIAFIDQKDGQVFMSTCNYSTSTSAQRTMARKMLSPEQRENMIECYELSWHPETNMRAFAEAIDGLWSKLSKGRASSAEHYKAQIDWLTKMADRLAARYNLPKLDEPKLLVVA